MFIKIYIYVLEINAVVYKDKKIIEFKWIFTYAWTKWLDFGSQLLDSTQWNTLFITKVNVKDMCHLLVSSHALNKTSVPVLKEKREYSQ